MSILRPKFLINRENKHLGAEEEAVRLVGEGHMISGVSSQHVFLTCSYSTMNPKIRTLIPLQFHFSLLHQRAQQLITLTSSVIRAAGTTTRTRTTKRRERTSVGY